MFGFITSDGLVGIKEYPISSPEKSSLPNVLGWLQGCKSSKVNMLTKTNFIRKDG